MDSLYRMLEQIRKYLQQENGNNSGSLNQGKQFNLLQKLVGKTVEGFDNGPPSTQPDLLHNLDKAEMDTIQNQINSQSNYDKLLSDCSTSVKLYNDELAKGRPDFDSAESLRNSMVQTCALMDASIQKFRNDVGKLENSSNDLEINRGGNSALTLEEKLMNLQDWERKLNETVGNTDTLDGEIENNSLRTDSVYIKYFAWMFASVAMTSIVVHQLLKD